MYSSVEWSIFVYFQVASGPVGAHGVNVVMIVNQEYNPNIGNQD